MKLNLWTRKDAEENTAMEGNWSIKSKEIITSITEGITYVVSLNSPTTA